MRLAASLIVGNEAHRYLEACLSHLEEFCDVIVVLDDHSVDGTTDLLRRPLVRSDRAPSPLFDEHEGRARQRLLHLTLAESPTHILTLDADEFVTDGPALRTHLEQDSRGLAWTLNMEEVWEIDGECLCIREDGGWRPHGVTAAYRLPGFGFDALRSWRIPDRALACGRVPAMVTGLPRRATGLGLLHFGWANPEQRQARADRYKRIDGGLYHDRRHLDSIEWPPEMIALRGRPWPPALAEYRAQITGRATHPVARVS